MKNILKKIIKRPLNSSVARRGFSEDIKSAMDELIAKKMHDPKFQEEYF